MDSSALKNEFLVESFENLSSINEDLTQIEKDPSNKELLNKLYRTVHTMKGSASFLGYKKLQDITHAAENLLDELRENKFLINPDIVDSLLETFDICNLILKSVEDNDNEGDVEIDGNRQRLDDLLLNKGLLVSTVEAEQATTIESVNPTAESSSDNELDSLISGHKTNRPGETLEEPQEVKSDDMGGLSAAALESLQELIGEGKMDQSAMDDLKAEVPSVSEKTGEPVTKVEVEAQPAPKPELVVTPAEVTPIDVVEEQIAETIPEPQKVDIQPVKAEENTESKLSKSIADSFVRVNVKVLDKIMNIVGELVLNRNQIVQYSNVSGEHEFSKLSQQLNIITSELQSEVMSTRMQPIGSILTKFERLVRDFSRQNSKNINLQLSGQETELDKTLIEAIKDPLVHIIRNACDHGMETIDERKQIGKIDKGTILIKAYNESGQVTIEIVDDGRGLDRAKIGGKAVEKGVISPEKFEKMTDIQVYNLIFAPGFSTAEAITNISGRGVGMDVVKTNIEKIGGSVSVNSELGVGTTFKMRIPLTLAIVPALIIKSKEEAFAIPQLNLVELVRLETVEEKGKIEKIQGSEFLRLRGELTPVFRLNGELKLEEVQERSKALLEVMEDDYENSHGSRTKSLIEIGEGEAYNIVILSAEDHYFGIIVDEILDTEEIVVKPLSNSLKQLNLFGGATIMGDGKVALILDALGFLNTVSDVTSSLNTENEALDSLAGTQTVDGSEIQENLLFRSFDDREYAVPLSLVSRLEEFSVSNIEMTGNQPIIRYLNSPMPLINIEKTLLLDGVSSLENYKEAGETALCCIVTTLRGSHYGVIVKEVLDISIDKVTIDDTAVDREGILGTIFIQDQTISLIDLYTVIEAQNIGNVIKKQPQAFVDQTINNNQKILVVDDSPMYRKMESDLLINMGFDVQTANHGAEAFEKVKNEKFDLIITDIEMPLVNGYELAAKIRTELENTVTPILALSTCFTEKDQAKGKESGFTYHLEKFKKNEVADMVKNILSKG
jgi:two-component system chemotaxis sensor kinase CheA